MCLKPSCDAPVCRGVYLAAVFYHKDSLLVTAEDQIPIVEVDDSYGSSLMQDFLWFTKVRPCGVARCPVGYDDTMSHDACVHV